MGGIGGPVHRSRPLLSAATASTHGAIERTRAKKLPSAIRHHPAFPSPSPSPLLHLLPQRSPSSPPPSHKGHPGPLLISPQGQLPPPLPPTKVTEIPVACVGLLHLMKCYLGARDYYHEAASHCATPVYARLAIFVACKRPELLHLVGDFRGLGFTAQGFGRV
eukprot:364560-Chlamydomonas_euryale.AAC.7